MLIPVLSENSSRRYSTKPKVKVTVHAAGTDQSFAFQLDPASGEAYAQTAAEGPIYKIGPSIIKELTKDLFALQDKRLQTSDIALLSIKHARNNTLWFMTGTDGCSRISRPKTAARRD